MADERHEQALAAIEAALEGLPSPAFRARLRRSLENALVPRLTVPRGARPGFTAVTPVLRVPDVDQIVAFAHEVFDARETSRSTDSAGILHSELRIGDSMLMLSGGFEGGASVAALCQLGFHVYVDDVDAVYERALDAGAESFGAPADLPYGERSGFVKDAGGNRWYIATTLGPASYVEGRGMVTPHLYVQRTPERGAPEFIEFVQTAFGAELAFRVDAPTGTVAHAVLRIGGASLELGEGVERLFDAPAAFQLYVEDCDTTFRRAVEAGGRPLDTPADRPSGDRVGSVEDPWGNEWRIATFGTTRRVEP